MQDQTLVAVAHLTARDYFTAIGLSDNSPVSAGQVAGVLEYFGLVAQPDTHAPSPHVDVPAAVDPAPVAAPASAPVVVTAAVQSPSIKDRVVGDIENVAESLVAALLPALTQALAAKL